MSLVLGFAACCADGGGAVGFLHLPGAGDGEGVGGDIIGDGAAGADDGAVADVDRGDQGDIRADEHVGADGGAVFGVAIVIAGDGARADIGAGSDGGVAEIGEVIDLGAGAEMGGFDFAEIADMGACADDAGGADAGEGADDGAGFDGAALEVGECADGDVARDGDARADEYVRLDGDIGFEDGVGGEKDGFRGGHGDAGCQCCGAQAGLQGGFGGGEFGAGIDAEAELPGGFDDLHGLAVGVGAGDKVGEVIFAFGVVIIDGAQPASQGGGWGGEAADIAERNGFFC